MSNNELLGENYEDDRFEARQLNEDADDSSSDDLERVFNSDQGKSISESVGEFFLIFSTIFMISYSIVAFLYK